MDADGSNIQRLTNVSNALDWSPDWSPDGRRIAFARSYSSPTWRSEIWLINPDGSNAHRLGNVEGQGLDWSPDGSRIAYFNYVEDGGDIWVMDADGSYPMKLTDHPAEGWWPKFSPDGRQIAFQSKRDGNHEIYVMNSDGSNLMRLTNHPADDEDPNWSPDGKVIAFISIRDGHYEVYTMNADGSNQTRITATNGKAIDPDWRPVLKQPSAIKALNTRQDDFSILKGSYLGQKPPGMTPEIFAPGIVSSKDFIEMGCTWSPDLTKFYFARSETSESSSNVAIWCVREEGDVWTEPRVVSFSGVYRDFGPFVPPDGKHLIFFRMDNKENKTRMGSWVVDRTGNSWGEPRFFNEAYCLITHDFRTFYFTTERSEETSKDIGQMKFDNGVFSDPIKLPGELNTTEWEAHECISPEGSYMLFDRVKSTFVSFLRDDGTWSRGNDLGRPYRMPAISPDGKYLFFESNGDIYWVDAKIIEGLK
jgi:Tol biopolymer transport system component